MGFLQNKKVLITGLLSNRSIAWGIAKAMQREGADIALTYQGDAVRERVEKLAKELNITMVLPCDVAQDQDIDNMFSALGEHWDGLDVIVHSIAFAPRESLSGNYLENVNRESFRIAHDISSYSFAALAKAGLPLMKNRQGSLVTLSYLGAEKSITNYNVMGLAKASLEANVRYMAQSLGPQGIRVNAISAGPIKTLAAAGIGDFNKILNFVEAHAPMRRNVTIEDVGNTAAFLSSDLALGITGEVIHVDAGFFSTIPGMVE
ncbi:MAG: enoyl-ACP reductase [Ferrovum sp. 37-45-19]|uniref:enoyl-ACP reductase FabI n=1 Tax=Ferrovum sp. JA12 TaxID=1356299 RepID=UPI0007032230|nr:SDR family oxidoreductase [Ferrovum sp. JA12]OYV79298.1 MAG: enoyl-ACP reductase [Ferrovum sp. 21-44-67]OYV94148.1 MAG: enoyl-ACP reductase [Ferrovum sp. 37-45-19]OZB34324.1 MAG: enoyl-ACP reductase [Ferrovum sp. 34-44-207]HQT81415.1 SDR family oxidoreductase [Ferrovaceae bacterium]KRH78495.1 enoyl-[acyl-carrier-protein] reductase [NADH] FabI [Ferrovum sp. JA12]